MDKLVGRYIIVCDNKNTGNMIYLCDSEIYGGKNWTTHIMQSKRFTSYSAAMVKLKNVEHYAVNKNIRIRFVNKGYTLMVPREESEVKYGK